MHHLILLLPLLALGLFLIFPWWLALPLYLIVLAVSLFGYWKILQTQRLAPASGARAIIGGEAVVVATEGDTAEVHYRGEVWSAVSSQPLHPGQHVIIQDVEGLTLRVAPLPSPKGDERAE
jgi:membrane protein implicated in regulation of membrane protease activity